ncbi:MAG TPA: hypothetical protein VLM11_21145 [Streptosporangiaceae bacterium]|nr:hypothetical protein [Streptosporangiaceae bacterium]
MNECRSDPHGVEDHPPLDYKAYREDSRVLKEGLDNDLIRIRRDHDGGRITELEACWLRCTALEKHIAGLAALRLRYLGD